MLRKSCCIYSTGILSILILILGISLVLSNVFPHFLQALVKKEVTLKNGTEAFDAWENPPAPIYMQFYFFNLTNPLEVLDGNRPAVVEIGPYTYREYRPMEEINFLDNGTKVSAVNTKTYIFQPNMSRGPETDLIRTVNIPAMTVMDQFKDNTIIGNLISAYMRSSGEGLFTTRTVGELLWGYEDGLLKALKLFKPALDDVFGLFYKNNASNDGEYVFFTGQKNYKDFARVDTWNGKSSLDWWTTDECNMINGTNGSLYMFSSDMCRSLYAEYEEDVTVKGIAGYRFSPLSKVFANATVNPDNAGFCVPAGNCLGSGVLNVSVCKQGAPILMSSPHFYQADEKFVQDVFGMRPKKECFLIMNALDILIYCKTGFRLSYKMYVCLFLCCSQTGNVSPTVFPVVWLNESVVIDDASVLKLKTVMLKQAVVENIPFMLIGLGILIGLLYMFLMCRQKIPEVTKILAYCVLLLPLF
uniref:Scavenger receptor class B, member 2c n=1 Tax=Neogobius melanostomus TaxID=47308 RepID=A0A8C6WV13_9GOBI